VKTIQRLTQQEVVPKINTAVVKVDELLDNTRTITARIRDSAETATTTTTFVAERVASPVIRLSSVVAGVRAAASSLAHRDNGVEKTVDNENS